MDKIKKVYVCWEQHYDDPIWIPSVVTEDKFEEFIQHYKEKNVISNLDNVENVEFIKNEFSITWKLTYKKEYIKKVYKWLTPEKIEREWYNIGVSMIGFNYQIVTINSF